MNKVNIGSGSDYIDGWINIDVDGSQKADIHTDILNGIPLKDESINTIKAQDFFEHFTSEDIDKVLSECWRILIPGGYLKMRVPNVFKIIEKFKNDPDVMMKFLYGDTSRTGVYGSHKTGFTEDNIKRKLIVNGFKPIKIDKSETNYIVNAKKINKSNVKIKIIISNQDSSALGGAERLLVNIASEFRKKKIDLQFISVNKSMVSKYERAKKYKVNLVSPQLDLASNWKGLLKFIIYFPILYFQYFKIIRKFTKEGGNTIISSGFSDFLISSLVGKIFNLNIIWVLHVPLSSLLKRNFYLPKIIFRLIGSIPDLIFVPTVHTKVSLIRDLRISDTKIIIIPLGIEKISKKRIKKYNSNKNKLKKELGYGSKKIIGMISRLEKEKGQDTLIKAVTILKSQIEGFKILIIGEGAEKKYLEDLIKQTKTAKYVDLLGYKENKWKYLSIMDLFVFPTRWSLEGFGLVILEAMSMGIPVITSNIKTISEWVGDAAYLIDPNEKELSKAIKHLLSDSDKYKEYVIKGQKKIEKYNISETSERIFTKIYNLQAFKNYLNERNE